ncbi:MAG: S1 RNA-binding domain-containing protein, partial [Clostridia bacterium]|nr:S1 RNA-binding domain-containing protein [Clostridia bacterium]
MEFEIGTIVEGKVTGVTGFGAFVDLGEGKTGMVHVSEVSRTYVKDIKEFVKEGDTVKAKIISVEGGKISLSMKQLQEDKRPARRDKSERKYVFSGRPENVDW